MFRKQTFIPLLLSYISGVLLVFFFSAQIHLSYVLLAFAGIIMPRFFPINPQIKKQIESFSILLFFLVLGIYRSQSLNPAPNTYYDDKEQYFIAQITSPVKEKETYYTCRLELTKTYQKGQFYPLKTLVQARIEKGLQSNHKLIRGAYLIAKTKRRKVTASKHLYDFDYALYLKKQGIHQQVYIASEDYKIIYPTWGFIYQIERVRSYLSDAYKKYPITKQCYTIVAALSLGLRDNINTELQQIYADNGVIHVLAVSGLHIGILYFILQFFLNKLSFLYKRKTFKLIVLLSFMWLYAFIAGALPSVLRATIMFSFIALGNHSHLKVNIYNSIFSSAFCLLLYQPLLLFDIGFQLSYLAVLSIVFFQKKIQKLWSPQYFLTRKIWVLVTVSIAAQLGTLPISLYYFSQFPSYFIVSNLLTIPIVTLLLWLSFLFFITHFLYLTPISKLIILVMNYLVDIQVLFLEWISTWYYATIKDLHIDIYQVFFLYLFILMIVGYQLYQSKRYAFIVSSFLVLMSFFSYRIVLKNKQLKQKRIIVYQVANQVYLQFIKGVSSFVVAPNITPQLGVQLSNIASHLGIKHHTLIDCDIIYPKAIVESEVDLFQYGYFFRFQNKNILYCPSSEQLKLIPYITEGIDVLIISAEYKYPYKELIKLKNVRQIIMGKAQYYQTSNRNKDNKQPLLKRIHSLKRKGDYQMVLSQ